MRLGLSLAATGLDASHEVDDDQLEPDLPPEEQAREHVLDFEMSDVTLTFEVGLRERMSLEAQLPFRQVSIDATFRDRDGRELLGFQSIHHRTETISGIADLNLWWRYLLRDRGVWSLDLRAGVTAPTGGTEEDPFELGERGLRHQHVFFGSGTWDPLIGLDASRPLSGWRLRTWLRSRLPVSTNDKGYRAGARSTLGGALTRPFAESPWVLLTQLEFHHEEPSSWQSRPARNSGRSDLVGGLGGAFRRPDSPWTFVGTVRLPHNVSAEGGQVGLQPIVGINAVWSPTN